MGARGPESGRVQVGVSVPRKASTSMLTPLMALKKMFGSLPSPLNSSWEEGVEPTTTWRLRSTGFLEVNLWIFTVFSDVVGCNVETKWLSETLRET